MPGTIIPGLTVWEQDLNFVQTGVTTVTGVTATTSIVPVTIIPANYFTPGMKLRAQIYGVNTFASTPGTMTFSVAYGASVLATSIALTGVASLSFSFRMEVLIVCTDSTTLFAQSWLWGVPWSNLHHASMPASAPAAVSALNFTVATNLDFRRAASLTTGTTTVNLFTLESLGV